MGSNYTPQDKMRIFEGFLKLMQVPGHAVARVVQADRCAASWGPGDATSYGPQTVDSAHARSDATAEAASKVRARGCHGWRGGRWRRHIGGCFGGKRWVHGRFSVGRELSLAGRWGRGDSFPHRYCTAHDAAMAMAVLMLYVLVRGKVDVPEPAEKHNCLRVNSDVLNRFVTTVMHSADAPHYPEALKVFHVFPHRSDTDTRSSGGIASNCGSADGAGTK